MKRSHADPPNEDNRLTPDTPLVKRAKTTVGAQAAAVDIGAQTSTTALVNGAQPSTAALLNGAQASDPIMEVTPTSRSSGELVAQSHTSDFAAVTTPTTSDPSTSITDLNMDCMEIIFSYFDYVELVKAAKTCKMWHPVAYHVMKKLNTYTFWDIPFRYFPGRRPDTDAQLITMFQRTNLSSLTLCSKPGNMTGALMNGIKAYCPNLTHFHASGVPFKKKTAMAFFAGLPKVTTLILQDCGLTNPIFSTILTRCKSLKSLHVANNKIEGQHGFEKIANVSPKPNIKHLSIGNNTMNCYFYMDEMMEALNQLFPQLEYLDISKNYADPFFRHTFRLAMTLDFESIDGYNDYVQDEKELHLMSSLKELKLKKIGGENKLCHWDSAYPIHPRFPNLEFLDLTDNCLDVKFLVNLSRYCPKLKSLDLSGCAVIFKDFGRSPVLQSDAFNLIFPALANLKILKFNAITEFTPDKTDLRISGASLFNLVENMIQLTQLKVLELGEYPGMSNELVVKLIVGLPHLKELKIHMCYNVTFEFLTTLNAHPDFPKRTEKLNLMVYGSGLWDEEGFVPDLIELDFNEKFQLFEEYTCPFLTGRIRASGSFMDWGDSSMGEDDSD